MFKVFNHNDTFLGEFPTRAKADAEAASYRNATGNAAYVDDSGWDEATLDVEHFNNLKPLKE
jgi:hypothetical protein